MDDLNQYFIFYSWKKCKAKLSTLTNTSGDHRPGQSGTTGDNEMKNQEKSFFQLFTRKK